MQREFHCVGMSFSRFSAVNGTELPAAVMPYFCDRSGEIVTPLRAGEIGCYASHLAIWQEIATGQHGTSVLVCEDDVVFASDTASVIAKLLVKAPAGWDVVRLSSRTERAMAAIVPLGDRRSLVHYSRQPSLSGAYLISREGAAKLLKPGIRRHPIDVDLSRPWAFGTNIFGVFPPLITQLEKYSIVQEMGGRSIKGRARGPVQRAVDALSKERIGRLSYALRSMGLRQWATCATWNASRKLRLHRARALRELHRIRNAALLGR